MDNRGEDRKDFAERRSYRMDDGNRGERRFDDGSFRPRRPRPEDGGKRDFRRDGFRPRDGRPGRDRTLGDVMDIDGDILHLIMRRTQMAGRLRRAGRLPAETEKKLRMAWEDKAARMGRNPRISRDLFVLLQSLEPLSQAEEEQGFYNLSPRTDPVDIRIPAPSDSVRARLWLAAAAASGSVMQLKRIPLTDDVIACIKTLNQLGGDLRWEENGDVASRGGGLVRNLDKAVHAGESALNLWLAIALCAGMPARLKVTGDGGLKFLDLAPVRRFLPALGIRMTNVVPAQDGLPVRLEFSGVLPAAADLPGDLPDDFIAALVLASPFWESPVKLNLPERPVALLARVEEVLKACGVEIRTEGRTVSVSGGVTSFPDFPAVPMDASIAAAILMMPGFNGGRAEIEGSWCEDEAHVLAGEMLRSAGLSVSFGDSSAACTGKDRETALPSPETMARISAAAPELLPLAAVITAAAVREGTKAFLPDSMDEDSLHDFTSFLARCGVEENDGVLVPSEHEVPGPWLAPSAQWAMAFALGAFMRPNRHLANPGAVSSLFPAFWNMYNSLPRPELRRRAAQETEDAKTSRRRVIARGVYGELPPEPASDDD